MNHLYPLLFFLLLGTLSCDDESERQYTDNYGELDVVNCPDAYPGWNFTFLTTPTAFLSFDASFRNGIGIAVGDLGEIYRSTDSGMNWTRVGEGVTERQIFLVEWVDDATIYALTSRTVSWNTTELHPATLLESTDAGITWSSFEFGRDLSPAALHVIDPTEVLGLFYRVGTGGNTQAQLFRITEGGERLEPQPTPVVIDPRTLTELDGQLTMMGAIGIAVRDAASGAWDVRPYPAGSSGMEAVFDGRATGVIEGSSRDQYYHTTDGGMNWTFRAGNFPYTLPSLIYLGPDGHGVALASRSEIIGNNQSVSSGSVHYTTSDGGLNWEVQATERSCGYGSYFSQVSPGKIISLSMGTGVILERQ